ncbi:MAG: adenylosuccinate lyase [Tepidisphaera sp.]
MSTPTSKFDTYTSPLAERNASKEMLRLWSPRHKFQTWRRIWLAVAEAQHELGLPVTKEQVEELRANLDVTDADMALASDYERKLRHDVMAHVHAWGDRCPKAKGIIHLGMTSQDVVCNADLTVLRQAIELIAAKLGRAGESLAIQSLQWKSLPTLGFTHYQPAQPVTVGRRIAGWAYDLSLCFERLMKSLIAAKSLRGLRGATGTQASFLSLFGGDASKVDDLEHSFIENVTNEWLDFKYLHASRERQDFRLFVHELTGQTYPRVIDTFILADLASAASVLHKIATDIRLLSNRKELDEPFEDKQIGSSAMPYKRNPMRCERICGLTRFVMNLVGNAYDTAATQWLERTLDDSSNRRLSLPEAFLALDGALDLMHNVASGLIVHEAMVRKNLMAELPFMATENLLMECVKLGGDRQHYHEVIREHAQAAGFRVKNEGADNDLLSRLQADTNFASKARGGPLSAELNWEGLMDPMKYIGRSVEQTERFLKDVVGPLRAQYGQAIAALGDSSPKV